MKKLSRREEGEKLYKELDVLCDDFRPHFHKFIDGLVKLSGLKGKEAKEAKNQAVAEFELLILKARVSVAEVKFKR